MKKKQDTDLGDDSQMNQLIAESPLLHFGTSLQIYDKFNRLSTPTPNILQERIAMAYTVLLALGVAVRLIICKPRQVGCSTFCLEVAYHHGRRIKTDALIVANVKENSKSLLLRLSDYQRYDTFPWKSKLEIQSNRVAITNGTRFEVDTAENYNAGISRTRQFYFASEVGKWPRTGVKNDKRVMEAVLQSVPDHKGTVVLAESTPEGSNGWFYDTWQGALNLDTYTAALKAGRRKPGNGWVKVFAGWWEFEEYASPTLSDEERDHLERTKTQRELEGITRYRWTPEQIAWRRSMIAEKCSGSDDVFDEYYPEDDVRCFLVSGRPRFNLTSLAAMEVAARSVRPCSGFLTLQDTGGLVSWSESPDDHGNIQVWELPRVGCRYLVACDPATGADQTESDDPDRHSIQVWRAPYSDEYGNERRAALVARVRAPFQGESDYVAAHVSHLSKWYGGALVVLEINMGLHILELLKASGVPLYKREVVDENDHQTPRTVYGFKLKDRNMKRALVECLAIHIRERQVDIYDQHWLNEAKSFVVDKNGSECAPAGRHDDDVMAGAMALYTIGSATLMRGEPRRKKRKPKDHANWKRHVYKH